jgi:signal peptidase
VLTYQVKSDEPAVVSHRVTGAAVNDRGDRTFVTKGDNNDIADPLPVIPVQIKGTVWYSIPLLGWVNTAVNGDLRPFIVPVVVGGLLLYAGWMVVSFTRDKRRPAKGRRRA